MPTVEQSIDVNVDVTMAYDQRSRFESFPRWMEGVASVDQTSDSHLHWVAKVRNEFATVKDETREWDARITEHTRDKRISRESVGGKPDEKPNAGAATFRVARRVVVPRHLPDGVGTRRRARDSERSARCGEPGGGGRSRALQGPHRSAR